MIALRRARLDMLRNYDPRYYWRELVMHRRHTRSSSSASDAQRRSLR